MSTPCAVCRLPAIPRARVAELHRSGSTLREIADAMTAAGFRLNKDSVHRHSRVCLAPADHDDITPDPVGLCVAIAARDTLSPWPSIAQRLAERLLADRADAAADVVLSAVPELMRHVPTSTRGTDVEPRLEAEALAMSVREVAAARPDVGAELAAALRRHGADNLANALTSSDYATEPSPVLVGTAN